MFNEDNFPIIITGIIAIFGLFILFAVWQHDNEILDKEYYVTLHIDYCNGKSDTAHIYIKGDPKYLRIKNTTHSKYIHLAVPELVGYKGINSTNESEQLLILNVCDFKIISSQQIK